MTYSWFNIVGTALLLWFGGMLLYEPRLMLKNEIRATRFSQREVRQGRVVGAVILIALLAVLLGPRMFIR